MTWKPKKAPVQPGSIERLWEKYGTWVVGGLAVVLAVVLVVMLFRRHQETRARTGQAELEEINRRLPTAVAQLKRLDFEYGDTVLGPRIRLKLAQALFHQGEYDQAESLFSKLVEDKTLLPVERVQVELGLAYLAQERNNLAEARERFKQLEKDGLYAFEARRMLGVIDKMEQEQSARKGGGQKTGNEPKR